MFMSSPLEEMALISLLEVNSSCRGMNREFKLIGIKVCPSNNEYKSLSQGSSTKPFKINIFNHFC